MSITNAEHAILLGSLRKYVALINNGRGTPITSLRYFAALFEEVKRDISPVYWVYVERRVRDTERQWRGFEIPAKLRRNKGYEIMLFDHHPIKNSAASGDTRRLTHVNNPGIIKTVRAAEPRNYSHQPGIGYSHRRNPHYVARSCIRQGKTRCT